MIKEKHPSNGYYIIKPGQNKKPDHLFMGDAGGSKCPMLVEEENIIKHKYAVDHYPKNRTHMQPLSQNIETAHIQK